MTEAGFRQYDNPSQLSRKDDATVPEAPRNRGKRIVVMALKLLAFLLLMAGALLIVATIVTVVGVALLAGAVGVYRYAHRLERETVAEHSRTSPDPATTEGLSYSPLPGEGWREARDWERFPNPVPSAPRSHSWVGPFPPETPVPPDEILRRLCLVRAELTVYYRFCRYMFRQLSMYGFVLCGFLGLLFLAVGVDALVNEEERIGIALGVLAAAMAIPAYLNGRAMIVDMVAAYRRHRALEAEQRRLTELDAARPGGPAGGPAVRYNLRRGYSSRFVYTPPVDEAMRVITPGSCDDR